MNPATNGWDVLCVFMQTATAVMLAGAAARAYVAHLAEVQQGRTDASNMICKMAEPIMRALNAMISSSASRNTARDGAAKPNDCDVPIARGPVAPYVFGERKSFDDVLPRASLHGDKIFIKGQPAPDIDRPCGETADANYDDERYMLSSVSESATVGQVRRLFNVLLGNDKGNTVWLTLNSRVLPDDCAVLADLVRAKRRNGHMCTFQVWYRRRSSVQPPNAATPACAAESKAKETDKPNESNNSAEAKPDSAAAEAKVDVAANTTKQSANLSAIDAQACADAKPTNPTIVATPATTQANQQAAAAAPSTASPLAASVATTSSGGSWLWSGK